MVNNRRRVVREAAFRSQSEHRAYRDAHAEYVYLADSIKADSTRALCAAEPRLVTGLRRLCVGATKMAMLGEALRDRVPLADRPIVVFCSFAEGLATARTVIVKHGYAKGQVFMVTSKDRVERREQRITAFHEAGPCAALLVMTPRGGTGGVRLSAAHEVFLLDGWRNPAVSALAADVAVTTLVIGDTVDEYAAAQAARRKTERGALPPPRRRRKEGLGYRGRGPADTHDSLPIKIEDGLPEGTPVGICPLGSGWLVIHKAGPAEVAAGRLAVGLRTIPQSMVTGRPEARGLAALARELGAAGGNALPHPLYSAMFMVPIAVVTTSPP